MLLRQIKLKEISELREPLESAKTTLEVLNTFKKVESAFGERELAPDCLKIGLKLKELGEAFVSAKTMEEMLNALKKMESAFDERELAPACLRIVLKLKEDGEDPELIICFAK